MNFDGHTFPALHWHDALMHVEVSDAGVEFLKRSSAVQSDFKRETEMNDTGPETDSHVLICVQI